LPLSGMSDIIFWKNFGVTDITVRHAEGVQDTARHDSITISTAGSIAGTFLEVIIPARQFVSISNDAAETRRLSATILLSCVNLNAFVIDREQNMTERLGGHASRSSSGLSKKSGPKQKDSMAVPDESAHTNLMPLRSFPSADEFDS
jgi:hypothetical protein